MSKITCLCQNISISDPRKEEIDSKRFHCIPFWLLPLVLITKINSFHERALRNTYRDKVSIFQNLLEKDNWPSIHQKSLHLPGTDMFKVENIMIPEIINDILYPRTMPYKLLIITALKVYLLYSVFNITEILSYVGLKIWDLLPFR